MKTKQNTEDRRTRYTVAQIGKMTRAQLVQALDVIPYLIEIADPQKQGKLLRVWKNRAKETPAKLRELLAELNGLEFSDTRKITNNVKLFKKR